MPVWIETVAVPVPRIMFEPAQSLNSLSSAGPAHARRDFIPTVKRPESWLVILIAAQLLLWTLVPLLLATSLPLDVVSNGLAWGHEWQWGYYKHPPLPSWTVELFFDALGDLGPFLLSQIAIVATYGFVFLLGREFLPARLAAIGTLLLVGVYYFSLPSPEFNHNVAQMPVWAAASFAYYKALKTRRLRWWLALGVAAGIGLLTKYSTAVLLATMLLHMAAGRQTRTAFLSFGPYVAFAACLAIASPHLVWLADNHFPTFAYAVRRAGHAESGSERIVAPFKFLLAQSVDILPAIAVAAVAGLIGKDSFRKVTNLQDEDVRFVLFLTLGPPILTALLSLATGLGIRDMWGAPMWNLTGLLLALGAVSRWQQVSLSRLAACLTVLFCVGLVAYALSTTFVPDWQNKPSRTEWPDRALAQTFSEQWTIATHRPLNIVAGDEWLAGLIAMRAAPRPSVWADGSYLKSPWITPQSVAREGALVVWRIRAGNSAPPPNLAALPHFRSLGSREFAWPRAPRAQPLRVGFGIVTPTGAS